MCTCAHTRACTCTHSHPHSACLQSYGIPFNLFLSLVFNMCLSAELRSVCFPRWVLQAQITPTLKSNTCLIKRSFQTVTGVPDAITGIILPLISFLLSSLKHPTPTKKKISNNKPKKEKKKKPKRKATLTGMSAP